MLFFSEYKELNFDGEIIYLIEEQSFIYEPWQKCDFSVMIGFGYNSLDVCIDNMQIVHLSGLNPVCNWKRTKLQVPCAKCGVVKIQSEEKLQSGAGAYYENEWGTFFDEASGWACIGNHQHNGSDCVEIAKNIILEIDGNSLQSIWIKPIFR